MGVVRLVTVGWVLVAAAVSAPDEAEPAELFNGRDLDGWTTWLRGSGREDPGQVFRVDDGVLKISGDGFGYLVSERSWRDFRLVAEWRWGEGEGHVSRRGKARDSGVFVGVTGADGNSHDGEGAYMAGIEVNLFEGATGDFLLIRGDDGKGGVIAPRVAFESSERKDADGFRWWDPGGQARQLERWGRVNWRWKSAMWEDVRGFRGARDVEKPAGEWNRTEITCRDGAIDVHVNGVRVNRAERVWPAEGRVLLQCEGSPIWFRRVTLVAL